MVVKRVTVICVVNSLYECIIVYLPPTSLIRQIRNEPLQQKPYRGLLAHFYFDRNECRFMLSTCIFMTSLRNDTYLYIQICHISRKYKNKIFLKVGQQFFLE